MITVEAVKIMIIIIIEDQTALDRDFKKTIESLITVLKEEKANIEISNKGSLKEIVTNLMEEIIIVMIIEMETEDNHTGALNNNSIA
jgi:hypothetical protein